VTNPEQLLKWAEKHFWLCLALTLLALAVLSHWPVRNGFFGVDDFLWLDLAHWRNVAASFVGSQGAHDLYRPIFRLSTYLDALLFGRHAGAWHIENVLIHAANAFALALVLRAHRLPRGVCAGAALLFLFAPLTGECVDWISGRTASLSFLFMLLAIWRWTLALTERRTPWAAAVWMVLGAMTYEAGVALPLVLACLLPATHKRLGVPWRYGLRQLAVFFAIIAVFLLMRAIFLGTFLGDTDQANPHSWANLRYQLTMLWDLNRAFGTVTSVWVLGAALASTTFIPAFFPAGPCLLLAAFALLLPFINAEGASERFYYMMLAPLSVILVLPTLIFAKRWARLAVLGLLLAVLLPPFVSWSWQESVLYAAAGIKTKALIAAVHQAIPRGDGWANVIEGVPEFDDGRPMMGGYFETGIIDSYRGQPVPFVARSEAILASPRMLSDVLRIPARYWRYDIENERLVPMERDAWLDAHPEARVFLPR